MKRKVLTLSMLLLAACGQGGGSGPKNSGGGGGEEETGGAKGSGGTGGRPSADAAAPGGSGGGGSSGGGSSGSGGTGGTGGSSSPDAGGPPDTGGGGSDAAAPVSNRVLHYTRTSGNVHVPGISGAANSLRAALMAAGVMVDMASEPSAFTAANLAKYAGVIMVSTSGTPFGTPGTAEMAALVDFVRKGGGLAGFHAASSTEYGATSAFNQLLGAETKDQGGGFRNTDCFPEAGSHPTVAKLPMTWRVNNEEFYTFNGFNTENQVVLRCTANMGTDRIPISWVREEGAGRVFFTAIGHYAQIWAQGEQFFTAHALPAVLWTIKK